MYIENKDVNGESMDSNVEKNASPLSFTARHIKIFLILNDTNLLPFVENVNKSYDLRSSAFLLNLPFAYEAYGRVILYSL